MRIALFLFALGVVIMAGAITYALVTGNLLREAEILFAYPWFHVSMIDLYTGFFLFSGWIVYRERSLRVAIVWIVLLLTLGNLATCLYALIAAVRAGGEWKVFWLGGRASPAAGDTAAAPVGH